MLPSLLQLKRKRGERQFARRPSRCVRKIPKKIKKSLMRMMKIYNSESWTSKCSNNRVIRIHERQEVEASMKHT